MAPLLLGCNRSSKQGEQTAQQELAVHVKEAAPEIGQPRRIDFDGKVELVGYDIEPAGVLKPGTPVKLTLYWHCKAPPGAGWNLFTHLLDGSGERILNIDNVGPLRRWRDGKQALGPWAWQADKYYVDPLELTIPENVRTRSVQVVAGLWKGDERMSVVSGPHDRENRGVVANLATTVAPTEPPVDTRVPRLRVDKLNRKTRIKVDGKLDEKAWATAASTGPFRNAATGRPNRNPRLGGEARLLWNDAALYIGVTVTDTTVTGTFDKKEEDPHLWTADTIELMVDPDGDGDNRDYYEIQINPQNLRFDSRFDAYNSPNGGKDGPFGHEDWKARVESRVTVDGTLNDDTDEDVGYVVEARISWRAFDKARRSPPEVGDEWRLNFYAMQNNGGVAWSPILRQGNFHKASRFGRVVWAEPGWEPPGSTPSASASSGKTADPP